MTKLTLSNKTVTLINCPTCKGHCGFHDFDDQEMANVWVNCKDCAGKGKIQVIEDGEIF